MAEVILTADALNESAAIVQQSDVAFDLVSLNYCSMYWEKVPVSDADVPSETKSAVSTGSTFFRLKSKSNGLYLSASFLSPPVGSQAQDATTLFDLTAASTSEDDGLLFTTVSYTDQGVNGDVLLVFFPKDQAGLGSGGDSNVKAFCALGSSPVRVYEQPLQCGTTFGPDHCPLTWQSCDFQTGYCFDKALNAPAPSPPPAFPTSPNPDLKFPNCVSRRLLTVVSRSSSGCNPDPPPAGNPKPQPKLQANRNLQKLEELGAVLFAVAFILAIISAVIFYHVGQRHRSVGTLEREIQQAEAAAHGYNILSAKQLLSAFQGKDAEMDKDHRYGETLPGFKYPTCFGAVRKMNVKSLQTIVGPVITKAPATGFVFTTHLDQGTIVTQCIRSLIPQLTYFERVLLCIYYNESTKESVQIVRKALEVARKFENVEVIETYVPDQKAGKGLTGTWNRGIEQCLQNGFKGIIVVNHDIILNRSITHLAAALHEPYVIGPVSMLLYGECFKTFKPRFRGKCHAGHQKLHIEPIPSNREALSGCLFGIHARTLKHLRMPTKTKAFGTEWAQWFNDAIPFAKNETELSNTWSNIGECFQFADGERFVSQWMVTSGLSVHMAYGSYHPDASERRKHTDLEFGGLWREIKAIINAINSGDYKKSYRLNLGKAYKEDKDTANGAEEAAHKILTNEKALQKNEYLKDATEIEDTKMKKEEASETVNHNRWWIVGLVFLIAFVLVFLGVGIYLASRNHRPNKSEGKTYPN